MATRPPTASNTAAASATSKNSPPRYSVDVNGSRETIDTYGLRPGDGARGEGVKFRIPKGAKLELFDTQTRHAPNDVVVKKVGKDLHIAFPGSKIEAPDAIVQDYFEGNNASDRLIGKGTDGAYHPYVAASGKGQGNVATLADGTSTPQSLGKSTVEPWGNVAEGAATSVAQTTPMVAAPVPVTAGAAEASASPSVGGGGTGASTSKSSGMDWSTVGWAAGGVLLVGAAAAGGGGGGGGDTPAPAPAPAPSAEQTLTVTKVEASSTSEGAPLTYTVTLSGTSPNNQSFQLSIGGGTSTLGQGEHDSPTFSNGVQYDAATGTVTVPPNTSSFSITVPTKDDADSEGIESLDISVGGVTATASVTDNEGSQIIGVTGGGNVKEGGEVKFNVTLSKPTEKEESHAVSFTGTGISEADFGKFTFTKGVTYDAATHTLKVPAGVTDFEMKVPVADEKVFEGNETAAVKFDATTAPSIVITDSIDKLKVDSIAGPAKVNEGAPVTFTVNLNASTPVGTSTTFGIALDGNGNTDVGPMVASNGVTIADGKVTVPGGVTTFTITMQVNQDTDPDPNENLILKIDDKTSGQPTVITDDDTPPATVVTVAPDAGSVTVTEGSTATFVVTLSGPTTQEQKFPVSIPLGSGTVVSADDVGAIGSSTPGVKVENGVVTVPAGVQQFTITVATVGDTNFELDESLSLAVDSVSGATVVTNDDPIVALPLAQSETSASASGTTNNWVALTDDGLVDTAALMITAPSEAAIPASISDHALAMVAALDTASSDALANSTLPTHGATGELLSMSIGESVRNDDLLHPTVTTSTVLGV